MEIATKEIKVDGKIITVPMSYSLLQAAEHAGVEIPRFCYHPKLSIAGNCRMCMIEVKGAPKLMASCAINVHDLRDGANGEMPELLTKTEKVKSARSGAMEFLLINHPLDCPICDQGGECDLQDQAMAFGRDGTRYKEPKRAVSEKYMGPLIKTFMTRCIQCTRCVRFCTEIAGVDDLGLVNRGEDAQIVSYLSKAVVSELSGNLIDVCPVGALTSAPYSFSARPWELRKFNSFDVMDSVLSPIRIDVRGKEILRILPRQNDKVNDGWISDKARFIIDGLKNNRIDTPYLRKDGVLTSVSWKEALDFLGKKIKSTNPKEMAAIAGDLVPMESLFAAKLLFNKLGVYNIDCRQEGGVLAKGADNKAWAKEYSRFNMSIEQIEEADAICIIGCNPRLEAPIVNARIRKAWLNNMDLHIALLGKKVDLTYDYHHLGDKIDTQDFIATDKKVKEIFEKAKNPVFIVGSNIFTRNDGEAFFSLIVKISKKYNIITKENFALNILNSAASRIGAIDLDFLPSGDGVGTRKILQFCKNREIKLLFNFGADECDLNGIENTTMVYFGCNGDQGALKSEIVFPVPNYTEQAVTYKDLLGDLVQTKKAIYPPEECQEEWLVLKHLASRLDINLGFDNIDELRKKMNDYLENSDIALKNEILSNDKVNKDIEIDYIIKDYYLTNSICRSSTTMHECQKAFS